MTPNPGLNGMGIARKNGKRTDDMAGEAGAGGPMIEGEMAGDDDIDYEEEEENEVILDSADNQISFDS